MHIQPLLRQRLSKNLEALDKPQLAEVTKGTGGVLVVLHLAVGPDLHRGIGRTGLHLGDMSFLSRGIILTTCL